MRCLIYFFFKVYPKLIHLFTSKFIVSHEEKKQKDV